MLNRAKPHIDVEKILDRISSADLSNDDYVRIFENKFSKYIDGINAPLSISINQGRSALLLALKILKVTKGDEVIVQSLICAVAIDAILEVGATPVLVDNLIEDCNVSPSEIRKKITPKTKVIIVVHLYGVPCNIEEIETIARENNCYLIEDCAHSLGAKYRGKNVGTFGDISFFSFNFDKPLSTGDGGMLIINNKELIDEAKAVIDNYKRIPLVDDKAIIYGLLVQHLLTQKEVYNATLSIDFGKKLLKENQAIFNILDGLIKDKSTEQEVQKAVIAYLKNENIFPPSNKKPILPIDLFIRGMGLLKSELRVPKIDKLESEYLLMNSARALVGIIGLETIDYVNIIRNKNAEQFTDLLKDNESYILPVIDEKKSPTFLRYTILNNTKYALSDISAAAKDRGFELGNYNWSKPVHLIYPYNKIISYNRKDLKISEYLSSHLINLPVHYYVDEMDITEIVKVLNRF